MSRESCMRCGWDGDGVALTVVDLEAEASAEGAEVRRYDAVLTVPAAAMRAPSGRIRVADERLAHRVPERFGSEYRCRDRQACDRRLARLGEGGR